MSTPNGNGTVEKRWQTMQDNRVDAECRTNAAAGWLAFDADFPSGHTRPLDWHRCRRRGVGVGGDVADHIGQLTPDPRNARRHNLGAPTCGMCGGGQWLT